MPQLVAGDALREAAQKPIYKTAFVFKNQRLTHRWLDEQVNRRANGLLKQGHKPGDHVDTPAYNHVEYYEILFTTANAVNGA